MTRCLSLLCCSALCIPAYGQPVVESGRMTVFDLLVDQGFTYYAAGISLEPFYTGGLGSSVELTPTEVLIQYPTPGGWVGRGGQLAPDAYWYFMEDGDVFNADYVNANTPFFHTFPPTDEGPVTPDADGFLWIGYHQAGSSVYPGPDVWGWLQIAVDGTDLTYVADAVSFGSTGIIVGTATALPEPSTGFLVFGLLGSVAGWRRR